MELVTERSLPEERKLHSSFNDHDVKAMAMRVRSSREPRHCYCCDEAGHFKRDCPKLAKRYKQKSNSAVAGELTDEEASVAGHVCMVVSSDNWTVDFGATCHMCNSRMQFACYSKLVKPKK